jgi:PspA-Associated protein
MIVRIMGEGQYHLEEDAVGRLNELDDRAQEALDRDDEGELDRYLDEMAGLVRREGERLSDDDLSASDAIVPPSDMSLAETKMFFSDEGLIPDIPQ